MRVLKKPNREGLLIAEDRSSDENGGQNREAESTDTGEMSGKHALTSERTLHIINRYTIAAAAAGAIPMPGADVVAVSAIQTDMVIELADVHGLKVSREWGRHIAVMLTGSMAISAGARTVFSAIKAIPVLGSVLGGGTSAVASAVTTYAIGRTVAKHFRKGGTLNNTVIPKLRETVAHHVSHSRRSTAEMMEMDV